MSERIFWLHTLASGARLATMPHPKANDWLDGEFAFFKKSGLDTVVCLLEKTEMEELGLSTEEEICKKNGLSFIHFPIADFGLPHDKIQLARLVNQICQLLNAGKSVAIHCRMGIGRSSLIAATVLLKYGYTAGNVFNHISSKRGVSVPDTDEQQEWLLHYASENS